MDKLKAADRKASRSAAQAWWRERQARTPGYCKRCGLAGTHLTHDTQEERVEIEYHRTHPDVPLCDFLPGGVEGLPPARNGGTVSINVDIRVAASEMKNWRPETISKFFAGLAMVEDAVRRGRADILSDDG